MKYKTNSDSVDILRKCLSNTCINYKYDKTQKEFNFNKRCLKTLKRDVYAEGYDLKWAGCKSCNLWLEQMTDDDEIEKFEKCPYCSSCNNKNKCIDYQKNKSFQKFHCSQE